MVGSRSLGPGPARWKGRVFALRQRLADNLDASLPTPHSGLAKALVLGLRGDIPEDGVDEFRRTGTSHLLAISGLHVGVLLVLVVGLGGWIWGRRLPAYVLIPLAAVWLYALTSGLPVSVVTAAIMGSILLAGWALGRPHRILPGLARRRR